MNNSASAELKKVASRLEKMGKPQSETLFRLAQELDQVQNLYNNVSFDPSQESQVNPEILQDIAAGQQIQPLADAEVSKEKPPIESFIRLDNSGVPPNYDTHVCSVVFTAPKGTQESDMMNYILGIGKELSVEVRKFEWEKQEPKESKTK